MSRQASKNRMTAVPRRHVEALPEAALLKYHTTSLTSAPAERGSHSQRSLPHVHSGGKAKRLSVNASQSTHQTELSAPATHATATRTSMGSTIPPRGGHVIDRMSRAWKLSPGEPLRVGEPRMLGKRGSFRRTASSRILRIKADRRPEISRDARALVARSDSSGDSARGSSASKVQLVDPPANPRQFLRMSQGMLQSREIEPLDRLS